MSVGDADVGEGDGCVGEADGDGCGRRVGRVTGPPPAGADQVRRTSWDAEAEESKVRVS